MKKKWMAVVALILAMCISLSGCSYIDLEGFWNELMGMFGVVEMTPFSEMEYRRPNIEEMESIVEDCCRRMEEADSFQELVGMIYEAYAPLDQFSTAYALANIHYCKDLTDSYWQEEYTFCSAGTADAQAALDKIYRTLAKSPFRAELESDQYFGAGFFDDYEGESFYDEVFTGLLTQEAELENQYYALVSEAGQVGYYTQEYYDVYYPQMAELFVELVKVRQEMADYLGYDNYVDFAYDYYYDRDYTPAQTTSYLADIRAELVPLYSRLISEGIHATLGSSNERTTKAYVKQMAQNMGGLIADAFADMELYDLYDISCSENKYDASFEVYISNYYSPYIFLNPTETDYDKLTFAHEFGHFCSDYASYGSAAGVDVAEVFSQGMEYLSLLYVEDVGDLEVIKMVDCLSVFVEQSAFASFEQQVYSLKGDELTTDNVRALYAEMGRNYGFYSWGFDSRDYVTVTHFFTNPMYVISYVVSNDVAMQMYQLELQESGAGLTCLENNLTTTHSGIVAFTQEAGLTNPFTYGRIAQVKETLEKVLFG